MIKNAAADAAGRMPVLFIGHGSPMNMVQENPYTRSLAVLGNNLPRPAAIVVISAHWLTRGTLVTCADNLRRIYDFYGFPEELYRVTYPCPGAPGFARKVTEQESTAGIIRCDTSWGLDHASYAVLRHLFPAADIPVFEMSLDYQFGDWHPKPIRYHYDLGKKLRDLRNEGILIIGSGNMVHNLHLIDPRTDAPVAGWAEEADAWMRSCLAAGDHDALIDAMPRKDWASLAVPTLDHYLPMIYALALREPGEPLRFTHEGFQNGSVSMRGFRIG
jgi:4,5-DOPA dioxygenase extradiol